MNALRWSRLSGESDRHVRDAVHIYEVQRGSLDEPYMDHCALRLGVTDLLDRVRREAVMP